MNGRKTGRRNERERGMVIYLFDRCDIAVVGPGGYMYLFLLPSFPPDGSQDS